jgi:hypothetical protein
MSSISLNAESKAIDVGRESVLCTQAIGEAEKIGEAKDC